MNGMMLNVDSRLCLVIGSLSLCMKKVDDHKPHEDSVELTAIVRDHFSGHGENYDPMSAL